MNLQFSSIVWSSLLVDCISGSLITCLFALRSTAITVEDLNPAQEFLLHCPLPLLLILGCPTPLTCCSISLDCLSNTFWGRSEPCQSHSFPVS